MLKPPGSVPCLEAFRFCISVQEEGNKRGDTFFSRADRLVIHSSTLVLLSMIESSRYHASVYGEEEGEGLALHVICMYATQTLSSLLHIAQRGIFHLSALGKDCCIITFRLPPSPWYGIFLLPPTEKAYVLSP